MTINHNLKHYLLWSKAAYQSANFFLSTWSKSLILLMLILNWQVKSSSNFTSFFIVITHNLPKNFQITYFLLCIGELNKSSNFETFVYFGENLLNSSCHFPNYKPVFFHILHDSLVSWNITPPFFFSSKITYFSQKQSIKV